jgi:hypothetical protein
MLMAERHREEVLNTVLAACLGSYGADADPETILKRGRARPDVIANVRGLRCALEGKIADAAQAEATVLADAKRRIDQGIAHLAIAVVYPVALARVPFKNLPDELSRATLKFVVLTDAGEDTWHDGGINNIMAELRRAHDIIVRDDVLQAAVNTLQVGLAEVSSALLDNRGVCDRLVHVLGVGVRGDAKAPV